MSEGSPVAGRGEVWIEKYRPSTLDEVVGQEEITSRLERYVELDDLPHLLFSGPAGVGKCVTGDTPVLTNRGVERIEDVVGDVDGFGAPADGLRVLTFDDGEFRYVEPSQVYGKHAGELVSIRTRDGANATVTPEHKLYVLGEEGFQWKQAADLVPGERIVRPRTAPLPSGDGTLDWMERMDGDRTLVHVTEEFAIEHDVPAEENYVGGKKAVVAALRRGLADDDAIARSAGLKKKTVTQYRRDLVDVDLDEPSTICSLSWLRELDLPRHELKRHVRKVQHVTRYNQRSDPITPPWTVTPELAAFVGLAVSEARLGRGIKFYNTDEGLLERFSESARRVFDVEPRDGEQKGVPFREIGTRTLTSFLESCFDVFDRAAGGDGIGSGLVTADAESRAAFLRAVFDAEAHVGRGGIVELTRKNGDLITLVSYLLSGFGVPSRRAMKRNAATNGTGIEREYHVLYVSGAQNLSRFEETVGFTIERKADRLAENAAKEPNPNDDTMPTQGAVSHLCDTLYLSKGELLTGSLNPESPGRENYLEDVERVLAAANERLESAQEVLARMDRLSGRLDGLSAVPSQWVGGREALSPIEVRRELSETSGIRADRLLEYSDGRRTPGARRAGALLADIEVLDRRPETAAIQAALREVVESLGVPYEHVATGTALSGNEVINLLENDDHDLASLPRFATVAEAIREVAAGMLSMGALESLRTLEVLARGDLYYDEVRDVERIADGERVYDLTVPGTHNYVAGAVPTVMHNTTCATAIAHAVYGDDWADNFLELNASDERGIDVVRERIKNFARASFGGFDYRIIFLDEADSLCVPPGTEVVTGYPSSPDVKPIEEVAEGGEPIPSVDFETNEIQSDNGKLVDSGVADFFEFELADGRTVTASLGHPFFVVGADGTLVEKELRELTPGDEIADFKDDVGVSRCGICGAWTAGRFCSINCKNEGHSREMVGSGNPMYGTEWSDERREKIVEKLSDGRLAGENNPNYGGEFHGVHVWEMDEEVVERVRKTISKLRSGTTWDEWVVDADPDEVKENIGNASSEWWESLDDDAKTKLIEKGVENREYPVTDITGDNNPMRDPEVALKVSEALKGHEPTGGNVRHSEELGHLVRSDWEYRVAMALRDAEIDYEYEPAFELSDSVYHPDFLIGDTVIEVKGVAKLWGQTEKVKEFLETYGDDYTFVVVGDCELPHHEHYEIDDFDPALVFDGGPRAVQTVEIRRIEYSHRGKAYNISMEDTPNFMLANGVLTHNTSDAQNALRRTMEQFSHNTRFILSCNYSSRIIDPIQSRCAVFRFSPIDDEAVARRVREIAEREGIETTDDGVEAVVYAAAGDMRKAINALQAAAVMGETVDEDAVFTITATARPEEIEEMVESAISGDFTAARSVLDDLLTEKGLAGGDVIDQIHRSVWDFDLPDEAAVRLMDRVGEADYRITAGANERVQLEALLASLALDGRE